jgi:hypothetical protein
VLQRSADLKGWKGESKDWIFKVRRLYQMNLPVEDVAINSAAVGGKEE